MTFHEFIKDTIIPNIKGDEVLLTAEDCHKYFSYLDKREMGFYTFSPTGLVYQGKKIILNNGR